MRYLITSDGLSDSVAGGSASLLGSLFGATSDACFWGVVSSPPPPSPTTILPFISGCSSQWYVTVPDPRKKTHVDSPGSNTPVSNRSLSAVAVCASVSLLTNVTVVPGATLSWAG